VAALLGKGKRLKGWLGGLIGVLVFLLLAGVLAQRSVTAVEAVTAQTGTIVQSVEETGYVQSGGAVDLYAAEAGRIVKLPVEIGSKINKGQVVAVLENAELAAQIKELSGRREQAAAGAAAAAAAVERIRLQLEEAEKELARAEELFKAGVMSQAELESAQKEAESLSRSLQEQQAYLERARSEEASSQALLNELAAREKQLVVKSPAAGVVLELPVKKEQTVGPGTLLAVVAPMEDLEVRVDLLSDDLGAVREGQKALVKAPVLGEKSLEGTVKKIYPRAEEKTSALGVVQRRVPVIVALAEAASLKPGYEVRVSIITGVREGVLTLPLEAVRTTAAGKKEVMVVEENRIRCREVTVGASDKKYVEIISGLSPGEKVVRSGSRSLTEGARVKAQIVP